MSMAAELHSKAMKAYDAALASRRAGDETLFEKNISEALDAEEGAAQDFAKNHGLEPSRSILFRSAATIAMTACAFERALVLASAGLSTNGVPTEVRAELVALVKDANYRLNILQTSNIVIGDESLLLSLEGGAVGNGMVRQEVLRAKLHSLVTIIQRTTDRIRGLAFSDGRARDYSVPLFVSAPKPGSFAIEVRLGDQKQPDIDGLPAAIEPEDVLSEVVDCFEDLKEGDLEALKKRIPTSEYLSNFLALGRQLQPDGLAITSVELVGNLRRGQKRVRLITPKVRKPRAKLTGVDTEERVEVTGLLRVAEKRDEGKEMVEIVDSHEKWHKVHVPAALMADVVRPLWDSPVTITGRRTRGKGSVIELETIDPAEPLEA